MKRLNNFLYSGFEFQEDESLLKSKYKMLNSILLITIVFSSIFALLSDLDMHDIGHIQAKVNYACAFLLFIVIFYLRLSKENYIKSAALLLLIVLITFTSVLIFVPQDEFRMIWSYLIVYIAYSLLNNYIGALVMVTSIIIILISNYYIELQLSQTAITTSVFGLVITSLFLRSHINKITDYENSLHNALELSNNARDEIYSLNKNLEKKVTEEVNKNKLKQEMVHQQSKQAALGELLMHIAHQWKRPLASLGAINILQKLKLEDDIEIPKDELLSQVEKSESLIDFMSDTVETFRNYYQPINKDDKFLITDAVNKVLSISDATLHYDNIKIILKSTENNEIYGNENEFTQVILSIINNARTIFKQREINNPELKICIQDNTVSISDNAGGVDKDIINDIFSEFSTTTDGNGVGLYIAKEIVEKNGGVISVLNDEKGAVFTIEFLT